MFNYISCLSCLFTCTEYNKNTRNNKNIIYTIISWIYTKDTIIILHIHSS